MKKIISIFILYLVITQSASAQLDSIVNYCKGYLQFPYLSDGQQYRALVSEGEVAEFRITFYGGAVYRVVVASAAKDGSAIYRLYDKNKTELFSNSKYNNSTYWDFSFSSTVDCYLEVELPPGKKSGFILMFLGFKQ